MSTQRDDIMDGLKDLLEHYMSEAYGPAHGCSRDLTSPDCDEMLPDQLPYLWIPAPECEMDAETNGECNDDIFEQIPLEIFGRVARNSDDADSITEARCNELLRVIERQLGRNHVLGTTLVTVKRNGMVKRYLPKEQGAIEVPILLHYARELPD